jgi:putative inorganic carbon (HCO3(-)) transporter
MSHKPISEHTFAENLRNFILSPYIYIVLLAATLGIGYLIGTQGLKTGVLLMGALVGLPILIGSLADLRFGIIVVLIFGYFLMGIKRMVGGDLPLGILLDVMMLVLFIGLLIKQLRHNDWRFMNNATVFLVIIWIIFNLIELFNPVAASREAWFYTVRGMAGLTALFIIALDTFNSLSFIKLVVKIFVGLALLAALYGIWQEFMGFNQAELAWIYEDPKRFELIFQFGRFRIFSFLSDPTAYGILMAYMSMFCLVLATGPYSNTKRAMLAFFGVLMLLPVGYAGTRTAYVLVPAAVFFYVLINPSRRVLTIAGVFLFFGMALVMKSTSNPIIYRIQSAFTPKEDASMQLRLDNQKFIQPFIQTHALGGGLGSTGVWGKRFSPDNMLSNFPPDSGFVRTAVEQGWLGLLLYCLLLFVAMASSVHYYIRLHNPVIKNLYQALLILLFSLVLANYPQEAIILLPNSVIFYLTLAALVRLKDFDEKPVD